MSTFKDTVYEEMDDISKLVEPFEYEVNNELAKMPDEFEVDAAMLSSAIGDNWSDRYLTATLRYLVRFKARQLGLLTLEKEATVNSFVEKMFKIEKIFDHEDEIMHFNAATGELQGGKILIVKQKIGVEDSEIETNMINYAAMVLNSTFYFAKDVKKKNVNAIADLFGADEVKKERSALKKLKKLNSHYEKLIRNRQLVIKDFGLFKRFMEWNVKYIKDGSLPAMSNISRLKIMTRSGNPIYSMKEDEV